MTFQPVIDTLIKILTDILNFVPRFVNGLIILIIGFLISAVVRLVIRFILKYMHIDQLADRAGVTNALQGLGIRIPLHKLIAQIVFFFLLLSFATEGMSLMGLSAIADLLNTVLRFIPRAISAALIIIFGSMLARFLGEAVSSVAESVNIAYSNVLGKVIEYAIVAFIIVLAISTLGVDTTILTTSVTIILACAGLAIALTFALGSRDAVRHVIAGFYVRQNVQPGQQVKVDTYSGVVRSTSGAYTVLESTDEAGAQNTVILPNAMLLENVVLSQENTSAPNQDAV
ncbi:MAG: mechanosensitive ion channel [Chloroflexota bacterium]|nr:mechanosensitive ion channel [Chloroflexota bacterium]